MTRRWFLGLCVCSAALILGGGLALSQSAKISLVPFIDGGEVRLYSYALKGSIAREVRALTFPWSFDDRAVVELRNIDVDSSELVERLEPASAKVFVNDVTFQDLVRGQDGVLRAHLPKGWTHGMRSFRLEGWDADGESIFIMGGNGIISY